MFFGHARQRLLYCKGDNVLHELRRRKGLHFELSDFKSGTYIEHLRSLIRIEDEKAFKYKEI